MRTTGIVRRVDDLGRIVKPREFRRAYDIGIGDPMEISADENGVITLKRVDMGAEFKRAADTAAEFLSEKFGWTVLACDRRKIICAHGKKHGVFESKDISLRLAETIAGYKPGNMSPVSVFGEAAEEYAGCYICPVTGGKGPDGAVIALSDEPFTENEERIIELCARLIANNMQKC